MATKSPELIEVFEVFVNEGQVEARPFTQEEKAQALADRASYKTAKMQEAAAAEAAATAKQAILDRLGLTAEEAALLLS